MLNNTFSFTAYCYNYAIILYLFLYVGNIGNIMIGISNLKLLNYIYISFSVRIALC